MARPATAGGQGWAQICVLPTQSNDDGFESVLNQLVSDLTVGKVMMTETLIVFVKIEKNGH